MPSGSWDRCPWLDGEYIGKLTDLDSNKTYSGSVSVSGNVLTSKGCVIKILCKSET